MADRPRETPNIDDLYRFDFYMKQMGAAVLVPGAEDVSTGGWGTYLREQEAPDGADRLVKLHSKKGNDVDEFPFDLRIRQFPEVARAA